MTNFHGYHDRGPFFEGWYLKQENDRQSLAFIPGMHILPSGEKGAFIQVITGDQSWTVSYSFDAFRVHPDRFGVKIGESIFSARGARIAIEADGLSCYGALRFGQITPLQYDAMGPFAYLPGMECRHGVLSLSHPVDGEVTVNGETFRFHREDGAKGYIEKDWGHSFPSRYAWVQCGRFQPGREPSCIMASVAQIPYGGRQFTGTICIVRLGHREIRLATYLGARAVRWDAEGIVVRQGDWRLEIETPEGTRHPLAAPACGGMDRMIREGLRQKAHFRLYQGGRLLFHVQSDSASCE